MLEYALKKGVPAEDIFLDYAGFSTYDSVYRAKAVFCAERLIVVTQKYHLFRALRICDALAITGKGVASNQKKYSGRYNREAREVFARDKDLLTALENNKVDAIVDDDIQLIYFKEQVRDDLRLLDGYLRPFDLAYVFDKTDKGRELNAQLSEYIEKILQGVKTDMVE